MESRLSLWHVNPARLGGLIIGKTSLFAAPKSLGIHRRTALSMGRLPAGDPGSSPPARFKLGLVQLSIHFKPCPTTSTGNITNTKSMTTQNVVIR